MLSYVRTETGWGTERQRETDRETEGGRERRGERKARREGNCSPCEVRPQDKLYDKGRSGCRRLSPRLGARGQENAPEENSKPGPGAL